MMKRKKTIIKTKSEFDYPPQLGYQVRINGRPVQVAMGESNWFPTKAQAKKFFKEVKI